MLSAKFPVILFELQLLWFIVTSCYGEVKFECQFKCVYRTILAYFEDTVDKIIGGKDDCCDICRNRSVKDANIDSNNVLYLK